jgi:hypothetical protein
VKTTPLLGPPAVVVTTTGPLDAPAGTTTPIDVGLQLVIDITAVPLNFTVLVPCVPPKFTPAIVTADPTGPLFGVRLVIVAGRFTVNATPLLGPAAVVTTTFPIVAPTGTATTIELEVQLLTTAAIALNATVLVPWVAPKLVPLIVTSDPTFPAPGFSAEIDGVCGHEAGLHGAGVSLLDEPDELDEPLAAIMTAAAAPAPAPRMMGNFLLPDADFAVVGCAAESVVGRFAGRVDGGCCPGSVAGRFAGL